MSPGDGIVSCDRCGGEILDVSADLGVCESCSKRFPVGTEEKA
jgi:hypothetical protein